MHVTQQHARSSLICVVLNSVATLKDPDILLWPEVKLARAVAATPACELKCEDAPDVCRITAKLITATTRGWAPVRHWLYHSGVRTAVHTVVQVSERLHRQASATKQPGPISQRTGQSATPAAVLPILPPEMWIALMMFFLRSNWSAL
jgi:hypothetical protein